MSACFGYLGHRVRRGAITCKKAHGSTTPSSALDYGHVKNIQLYTLICVHFIVRN